ncbi:MAG: hypothetical protein LJE95_06595 [Acidobacteria bacterium]|nr:hypothetical protein [Acidobacteriota bacterium]
MSNHQPGSERRWLAATSAVLAAVLLLLAAPPAAGEGRVERPHAGQTVRAGEVIEVRWTSFDEPVDELEILLMVDGKGRFPVRLTEQLAPRPGRLLWRVPDLPTPAARLVVRFGRDGHELLAEPGGAFRIIGSVRTTLPSPGFANGEWWLERGSPNAPLGPDGARQAADWLSESFRHMPAVVRAGHQGAGSPKQPPTATDRSQRRHTCRTRLPGALARVAHGLPRLE